jgi:glycosyltransferase involved in cell wall biosynthesis
LKIAIASKTFIEWGGGVDFIIYLANALALDKSHQIYFLVPDSHEELDLYISKSDQRNRDRLNFLTRMIYKPKLRDEMRVNDALSDLSENIGVHFYRNNAEGFIKMLDKLRADIVLPTTASFGPYFPFPWVGYIWDFQHKYFPKYFNDEELRGRDKIFKKTMEDAPAVLVNSLNTKEDIQKYINTKKISKVTNLPFSPYPLRSWLKTDTEHALKKYHIKGKYFIICNKFLLNKAHPTAFRAMSLLVSKSPDIQLICTGKMEEPRDTTYIDRIKKMVEELGISKNVRFLGLIPKNEQIALLRGSLALVQPTLYEGGPGGGAAYNAVALGVPVIASNVPVNLEMRKEDVDFFKADLPSDLAKKMAEKLSSATTPKSELQLIKEGEYRAKNLVKALNSVIDKSIKNHARIL